MKNIIEIKNLSYRYDHNSEDYILKNVSFHVKQGEWLSIVGHNGSGKSTTVRLIDGLLEAESGDIIISGDKLTADNVWEKRRQIGMVFQNPDNQFVGATVEDDVAFGLENQGMDYPMMVKQVHEALELVGMQDFKEREPARLSGGQKQRVAIAGVVALQPDIIILDEATSMLDPEGRQEGVSLKQYMEDFREKEMAKLHSGNLYVRSIVSYPKLIRQRERRITDASVMMRRCLTIFFLMNLCLGVIGTFWLQKIGRAHV